MILLVWYVVLTVLFFYSLSSREGFSQGVQYIRIMNGTKTVPSNIQIGELMAFDENGTNVALGKEPTASGQYSSGYSKEMALDGNVWSLFHSPNPPRSSDYWEVNLGKEYKLSKIEYHNRRGCCQERIIGCTMMLLDRNRNTVKRFKFKNGEQMQQFLFNTNKEATPAVRDRVRWL